MKPRLLRSRLRLPFQGVLFDRNARCRARLQPSPLPRQFPPARHPRQQPFTLAERLPVLNRLTTASKAPIALMKRPSGPPGGFRPTGNDVACTMSTAHAHAAFKSLRRPVHDYPAGCRAGRAACHRRHDDLAERTVAAPFPAGHRSARHQRLRRRLALGVADGRSEPARLPALRQRDLPVALRQRQSAGRTAARHPAAGFGGRERCPADAAAAGGRGRRQDRRDGPDHRAEGRPARLRGRSHPAHQPRQGADGRSQRLPLGHRAGRRRASDRRRGRTAGQRCHAAPGCRSSAPS